MFVTASGNKRIEIRLAKHVEERVELTEKQIILKSAPGVGDILVYTLLTDLSELGSLNRKDVSALVGVAPINHHSGK